MLVCGLIVDLRALFLSHLSFYDHYVLFASLFVRAFVASVFGLDVAVVVTVVGADIVFVALE